MRKWVWHIGLAAVGAAGGFLAACTSDSGVGNTAGSSLETENSIAFTILSKDGSPAARTSVIVRPEDFLAGANARHLTEDKLVETDSAAGIYNAKTDDQGQLTLANLKSGRYVVEARGEMEKAFARIVVEDSVYDSLSMSLDETGSVKGQVLMPMGMKTATVGVRGLDYFVQTDSLGNFEFPSLPEGSFKAVGFVFSVNAYVDDNGSLDTYERFQTLGVASVEVESAEVVENVKIGSKPTKPVVKDTSAADTVDAYPHVILDDFENDIYGWYTSVSKFASVSLSAAEDRNGFVAHMECSRDSNYNVWTMIGHGFSDFKDLSQLDSVVLWARAASEDADSIWLSVSFDVLVDNKSADSTLGYESGKAWTHVPVTEEWSRIVVTPDDLIPADSNRIGGNIGWDAVKDHVNSFGIFGGRRGAGSFEVWIDDVEIYGVKDLFP